MCRGEGDELGGSQRCRSRRSSFTESEVAVHSSLSQKLEVILDRVRSRRSSLTESGVGDRLEPVSLLQGF